MTTYEMNLKELRANISITKDTAYFQTGSHGPSPDKVLDVVRREAEFDAHRSLGNTGDGQEQKNREEQARSKLCSLLNIQQNELAITPNTSKALETVLHSFQWEKGDQIAISSLEHVSTIGMCHTLERLHNVNTKSIDASKGDSVFLNKLESALNSRTKLLIISEVASPDGRRLPIKEAVKLAHNKCIPIVIDGAQSVGQFPVDISSLGCDFYVGSGHKWLLGPRGVGYIYVSTDQILGFRPHFIPDYSPWIESTVPKPEITARTRVEMGTYSLAPIIGLGSAVEFISEFSIGTIEKHISSLSDILKREASNLPGVEILTPLQWHRSSGITTLLFRDLDVTQLQNLVSNLGRNNVAVKFQWLTAPSDPSKVGMRISTASFNTMDEIRLLIDLLKDHLKT